MSTLQDWQEKGRDVLMQIRSLMDQMEIIKNTDAAGKDITTALINAIAKAKEIELMLENLVFARNAVWLERMDSNTSSTSNSAEEK